MSKNKKINNNKTLEDKLRDLSLPKINSSNMEQTILSVRRIARKKQYDKNVLKGITKFKQSFDPRVLSFVASFTLGIFLTTSVFTSSLYALPGSWLYPIKLISEKIAYVLKLTPDGKAELKITFSKERLNEIIKTYDVSGKVDKKILDLLLSEAKEALLLSEKTERKEQIVKQVQQLNNRQIEILTDLGNRSTGPQKELFKKYLGECRQLMAEHHRQIHWGEPMHNMMNRM